MHSGDHVGSLRIERLLDVGGMGEVYLALDARLERPVAVKVLTNSDARERMLREARAASALRHPGIVTIHDIGEHEGRTFIVMEYVEGQTLDALVAQRGPLAPAEAVALIAQIGDALATAHDAGILHRDIKSANLMMDERGRARVLDFGLCKRSRQDDAPPTAVSAHPDDGEAPLGSRAALTTHRGRSPRRPDRQPAAGTPTELADLAEVPAGSRETPARADPTSVMVAPENATLADTMRPRGSSNEPQTEAGAQLGTPGWAPPELMDGQPAEVRSDVFSLGAVLYHLLTGQVPFPGRTWGEVRAEIACGPVPPSRLVPSISSALEAVILSALAVDLDRRPATVRDMVARAQAAVLGHGRRRALWGVVMGSIAISAGALAVLGRTSREVPELHARVPAVPLAPLAPLAFSPPERLTALGGCAYSPAFVDHDTVTFDLTRDGAVDLYRIDLGARAPIRLTSDPGWEWRSGPGRRDGEVAFIQQRSDRGSIETLDLASGERTVLMTWSSMFAFSGDTLYYSPGGEIRRRHGQRDEVMVALPAHEEVDSITAARDGSRLVVVVRGQQGTKVCVVATDTARMVCPVAEAGSGRAAFSPDASTLYFDRGEGIGRLRLADEVHDIVVPEIHAGGGIAVSPDGGAMVWSDCGTTSELIDPSAPSAPSADLPPVVGAREVRASAFGPGGRFAYVRGRAGTSQLIVRDPDGIDRDLVSRANAKIIDLAFSPDGSSLVFVLEDTKEPGIYLISIDQGKVANRLTDDADDHRPVFTGGEVVFTRPDRDRVPRLMRIQTDGSNARVASSRPRLTVGADWVGRRILLASPDLQWLYWWDPVTERESPGPQVNLAKLRSQADISLSSNGQWLLYLVGNNGREIWRQRLDGASRPELLRRLPDDITASRGVIDASGRAVVVAYRWSGDLWISRPVAGAP